MGVETESGGLWKRVCVRYRRRRRRRRRRAVTVTVVLLSLQKMPGLYLTSSPPLVFNSDELGGLGVDPEPIHTTCLKPLLFYLLGAKILRVNHRPFEPLPRRTVGGWTDRTKNRLCPGRGVVSVTPSALYRQRRFYAGAYCSFSEIANICAQIYFHVLDHSCIHFNFIQLTPILSNLLINILF